MDALNNRYCLLPLLASMLLSSAAARAEEPAEKQSDPDLRSWYLGAFVGQAKGEVGNAQMNQRMAEQGYDAQAKVEDLNRLSYSLLAGYQWSKYFALEAAYTDLGTVKTTLTGNVSDIKDFLKTADAVHPATADGFEFSLYGRYPFTARLDGFARLGMMYSDSDYHARASSGELDKLSDDGKIQLFGLGADYAMTRHWTLRAAVSRYQMDHEKIDVLGVGVLYQFLREPKKPAAPVPMQAAPSPVVEPAPLVAAAPPPPPVSVADSLRQQGFTVQQGDRGITAEMGGVLFATNSAVLTEKGRETAQRVAAVMNAHPGRKLAVEGHTDSQGKAAKNQTLSEKRAESVREALLALGITAERMVARGYGATYPVASNKDETGRQMNRRVEFVFSAQDGAEIPTRGR